MEVRAAKRASEADPVKIIHSTNLTVPPSPPTQHWRHYLHPPLRLPSLLRRQRPRDFCQRQGSPVRLPLSRVGRHQCKGQGLHRPSPQERPQGQVSRRRGMNRRGNDILWRAVVAKSNHQSSRGLIRYALTTGLQLRMLLTTRGSRTSALWIRRLCPKLSTEEVSIPSSRSTWPCQSSRR